MHYRVVQWRRRTAIVGELFHLLAATAATSQRVGRFVLRRRNERDNHGCRHAPLDELMARYHERPMDFTDATLVHQANRESVTMIRTIDHDNFETYRTGRRQRCRSLPERRLPNIHSGRYTLASNAPFDRFTPTPIYSIPTSAH
jgi:hypothetical protein